MQIKELLRWWVFSQNSRTWDRLAAYAHERAVEEISEKMRKEQQDEADKNKTRLLQTGEPRTLREHPKNLE